MLYETSCKLYLVKKGKIRASAYLPARARFSFYVLTRSWQHLSQIRRFNPPARVQVRYTLSAYRGQTKFFVIGFQSKKQRKLLVDLLKCAPGVTRVTFITHPDVA